MPRRPLRPCAHPGCRVLSPWGICDLHRSQRRAEWDEHRGSAKERGYDSKWSKFRAGWIRAHPLCGQRLEGPSPEHSRCWAQGITTPGAEVDHITPHKGDQRLFWDKANLQTLCKSCHSAKTMAELNEGRYAQA